MKTAKKIIKFILMALGVLMLLILFSGDDKDVSKEPEVAVEEIAKDNKKEDKDVSKQPSNDEELVNYAGDKEAALNSIEESFLKGFSDADIDHEFYIDEDDHMIHMKITQHGIGLGVSLVKTGGDNADKFKHAWDDLVSSLSLTIKEASDIANPVGYAVTFEVRNDLDSDEVLLKIIDGQVIVNILED